MRLTVAQALVRFLAAQEVQRDGRRSRFFAGCFGIFGHGNVAGLGQALHQNRDLLPYHPARNEQAMVHLAAGYARQRNRLGTFACTTSIGPGATNMVTGAAAATINRLPVLLLPGRRVRDAHAAPGAPAARGRPRRDRLGQRLPAPRLAILRARPAPRAADAGRARGDAGADRSGRDRRGHAGDARGRADRGVRMAAGVPRAAGVDDLPPAPGPGRARARGGAGAARPPAADRGGRRRRSTARRPPRCESSSTPPGSRSARPRRAGARSSPRIR